MSSDAPQPSAEPPKIIAGRYRIGKTLGRGTFGQVFYAEDIKFDPPRTVAVKLLHTQFLSDAQSREDIRREASVLARFHHPNILRVSDFEISADMAYIVTDFAEGGSLMKKLRPDAGAPPIPMALGEVVYYLEQIASALDEAHNLGLIHRDIKPLNILLDRAGRPLLADFGLATVLSGSASSMVTDLTASGTPLYMAPEQWSGKAGKASDIYALGVVTYQLITGQPPYTGNQTALWAQHTGAAIPALREKAPWLDYPPALDSVIAGAMAKDDRERTRPAGEFARRFKSAMMGSPAFQFNNRNQPPTFSQPGPNPGTGAPLTGPIASMTPGTAPGNQPGSYPTVGSFNNPQTNPLSQQQFNQAPTQINPPGSQSQPHPNTGSLPPGSQPQAWQPGGSIPPAAQPQAWQPNGPVPPVPLAGGGWGGGGPYATPQPPVMPGNGPVVTKKQGSLNPLLLVAGLLVLLIIVAGGVLFLLPKGNSSPTQVAANATGTPGAGAVGANAAGTPGATVSGAANNGTAGPTVSGPAATAAALVGTGQLQVTVTESNGKPAREADVTIKVFQAGNDNAIDTAYSKTDATFNLKPGTYLVEADYLNDIKVSVDKVEVKEGQPVKQAINLGLGQVQVEVVEATGKSARDGDVVMRVYKDGDTSKPVTVVYSKSKTGIYLKPGSYQIETDYSNDIKQMGDTFQVTEGQSVTQSVNLQVGTAQVEIYETTGRIARDGDVVIRVHKQDDPNLVITTVYSKAKSNITLKEGTYELEIDYTDSIKETSGPIVIKAGQIAKQTVNLQVGTAQLEVQLADGSKIDESSVIMRVYEQGNPNDVISTIYSKAKASVILKPGTYEVVAEYTGGKKVTGAPLEVKEGQTATQIIKI